jgi:hypothetical protein
MLPDTLKVIVPLVGACLLLTLLGGGVALAQPGGVTVRGEVVNGTPGGDVPTGAPVTLTHYESMLPVAVYTATVRADGSYVVPEVGGLAPEDVLLAEVAYLGVTYPSEPLVYAEGTALTLPVVVYEVTGDPASLSVSPWHLFVSVGEEGVAVAEFLALNNDGERAYVGDDEGRTLEVLLPEGATRLRFQSEEPGQRFVPLQGGFADTQPVPPGAAGAELSFRYELPPQARMERANSLPVGRVVILVEDPATTLEGEALTDLGVEETSMGAVRVYTAEPLEGGAPLAFTVVSPSGRRGAGASPLLEVGAGVVALLVATGLAFYLIRFPRPSPPPRAVRPLLVEVAALDEAHERGELPAKEHERLRQALLREIEARLREEGA